jgi:molecular chaperone DnaK (HSP70)
MVGGESQVGEAGLAQSVGNFKNTAYDLKRVLGKSWGDQEFEQDVAQLAYKVSKGDQGQTQVQNTVVMRRGVTPPVVPGWRCQARSVGIL